MRYSVETEWVKQQIILIENETDTECLCRVDVNHRLFKIIYLEAHAVVELPYHDDMAIDSIQITHLDH